jgi:hypothetical protein
MGYMGWCRCVCSAPCGRFHHAFNDAMLMQAGGLGQDAGIDIFGAFSTASLATSMRILAYFFTLLSLSLGMVWASAYAAFLGSAFVFAFFESETLSYAAYYIFFLWGAGVVCYWTAAALMRVWCDGPPPNFHGWRYLAVFGCAMVVVAISLLLVRLATPMALLQFFMPPSPAGILYVPAVLFAMAALPRVKQRGTDG